MGIRAQKMPASILQTAQEDHEQRDMIFQDARKKATQAYIKSKLIMMKSKHHKFSTSRLRLRLTKQSGSPRKQKLFYRFSVDCTLFY